MTPKLSSSRIDRLQHEADLAAIHEGIADMEAGRVMTLEALDARIQSSLSRGPQTMSWHPIDGVDYPQS